MLSIFYQKISLKFAKCEKKISHIKVKISNDFAENYQIISPYFFNTDSLLLFQIYGFSIPLTVFMKTAGLWDKTDIFWKCVPFFFGLQDSMSSLIKSRFFLKA